MEHVKEALNALLEETRFEIKYREYHRFSPADGSRRGTLRDANANDLREVYGKEVEGQNVQFSVRQYAPEKLMSGLLEALRNELEPLIEPGTERVGHTFPIEGGSAVQTTRADGGLFHFEYQSDLRDFARAMVQAAAVMGVRSAAGAVVDWCQGQPAIVQMQTVMTGLLLNESIALQGGVELVPLGLSTAGLPRLPMFQGDDASHYLGLTLLKLGLRTSPAIFRPYNDDREGTVRSRSDCGIDLKLVRDALSLVTNRHVALSRVWLEYPSAWGFRLSGPTTTMGTDRPKPRSWKSLTSGAGRTEPMKASTSVSASSMSCASFSNRGRRLSAIWRHCRLAALTSSWTKAVRIAAATISRWPLGT